MKPAPGMVTLHPSDPTAPDWDVNLTAAGGTGPAGEPLLWGPGDLLGSGWRNFTIEFHEDGTFTATVGTPYFVQQGTWRRK